MVFKFKYFKVPVTSALKIAYPYALMTSCKCPFTELEISSLDSNDSSKVIVHNAARTISKTYDFICC